MTRIKRAQTVENISRAVDEKTARLGWWLRYREYEIVTDTVGKRHIRADEAKGVAEYVQPLTTRSADLFLRFARWPEDPGMDKGLDTERNAEAAKLWADTYGVLGLNPPDMDWGGEDTLRRITAEGLAPFGHVAVPPSSRRNSGLGGPPAESVENFVLEVWDAHTVLQLYEALTAGTRRGNLTRASLEIIRGLMSTRDEYDMPGCSYVEREIRGQKAEDVRRWAWDIITEGIQRKVQRSCYPTIEVRGDGGGKADRAKQGWGFESLLGAMWLQMMWLVAEPPRLCRYCGRVVGGRKDKQYCDANCRADWNYHFGGGKSGKKQKKRSRLSKGS